MDKRAKQHNRKKITTIVAVTILLVMTVSLALLLVKCSGSTSGSSVGGSTSKYSELGFYLTTNCDVYVESKPDSVRIKRNAEGKSFALVGLQPGDSFVLRIAAITEFLPDPYDVALSQRGNFVYEYLRLDGYIEVAQLRITMGNENGYLIFDKSSPIFPFSFVQTGNYPYGSIGGSLDFVTLRRDYSECNMYTFTVRYSAPVYLYIRESAFCSVGSPHLLHSYSVIDGQFTLYEFNVWDPWGSDLLRYGAEAFLTLEATRYELL